jgi:hypothetical protein
MKLNLVVSHGAAVDPEQLVWIATWNEPIRYWVSTCTSSASPRPAGSIATRSVTSPLPLTLSRLSGDCSVGRLATHA